jgi:hypothetical protein
MLGALGVALILLLPTLARAQSMKAVDLVGTWTGRFMQDTTDSKAMKIKDIITFRPDSTYSWTSRKDDEEAFTRWTALTGDSLWLGQKGDGGYKVTLTDQQLTLSKSALVWIFKRTDVTTPKP